MTCDCIFILHILFSLEFIIHSFIHVFKALPLSLSCFLFLFTFFCISRIWFTKSNVACFLSFCLGVADILSVSFFPSFPLSLSFLPLLLFPLYNLAFLKSFSSCLCRLFSKSAAKLSTWDILPLSSKEFPLILFSVESPALRSYFFFLGICPYFGKAKSSKEWMHGSQILKSFTPEMALFFLYTWMTVFLAINSFR